MFLSEIVYIPRAFTSVYRSVIIFNVNMLETILHTRNLRYSIPDSYKLRIGHLGCKNVFVMQFYIDMVLRGSIRGCLMPELWPFVCIQFSRFMAIFLHLFSALEKKVQYLGTHKIIMQHRICLIFLLFNIKTKFPRL